MAIYLSRLILNPHNRRVQRELAEPYEMHRTLMQSFPDHQEAPEDERVLFRVDSDPRTDVPLLLMQSSQQPSWTWLQDPDAAAYLAAQQYWPAHVTDNPATKTFEPNLVAGQVLAFRLRANPTIKRQGKRYGLIRDEDQRTWLARKANQGGFEVLSVSVARQRNVHSTIHRNGHTHHLTLLAVRFDGLLQVTDADQLWQTVKLGVGSGKAVGFGLLSLAPAQ